MLAAGMGLRQQCSFSVIRMSLAEGRDLNPRPLQAYPLSRRAHSTGLCHLSIFDLVRTARFELATGMPAGFKPAASTNSATSARHVRKCFSSFAPRSQRSRMPDRRSGDSNLRPPRPKRVALPALRYTPALRAYSPSRTRLPVLATICLRPAPCKPGSVRLPFHLDACRQAPPCPPPRPSPTQVTGHFLQFFPHPVARFTRPDWDGLSLLPWLALRRAGIACWGASAKPGLSSLHDISRLVRGSPEIWFLRRFSPHRARS